MSDNGFWRGQNNNLSEKKRTQDDGFWRKPDKYEDKTGESLTKLLGLIVILIGTLFIGNRLKRGKVGYWTWFILGGLIALFLIIRAC